MVKLAYFIPLLPLLSFLVIVFLTRRSKALSSYVSIAGIFFSFVISALLLYAAAQNPEIKESHSLSWISLQSSITQSPGTQHLPAQPSSPTLQRSGFNLQIGVLLDPLSAVMCFMVTLVATLIQIYSIGYMGGDEGFSRYFAFMSLFAASMLTLVVSNNFLLTFISWEMVGLCSYLLIGFWYFKKSAADAAKKAFIVTRFGDLGLIIGIVILFTVCGTLNFFDLESIGPFSPHKGGGLAGLLSGWMIWGVPLLIFCGAVGKSAQFPLHIWLPDAMEGPTPVSALIHAATMVAAGVYLVARTFFLFSLSPVSLAVVATVGVITAFMAATMALVQRDIKRILAYSTVSQLGYMMLSLGLGASGYAPGTFHLLTHAFFKALLFLGAGSVIHAVHTNDIFEMGGLRKAMPVTFWTFTAATLSITGFPLFSGFFSKDEILATTFETGHYAIFGLALVTAFLTSFYMFRLWFLVFHGERRGHAAAAETGAGAHPAPGGGAAPHGGEVHESPPVMLWPLRILAIFSIFTGFAGTPWHSLYGEFVRLPGVEHHPVTLLDYFLMGGSIFVFLLGFLWAKILYGKGVKYAHLLESPLLKGVYNVFQKKYWMDDLFLGLARIFLLGLSNVISWIDTYLIDLVFVNGAGWVVGRLGAKLRFSQTGWVQHYVYVLYGSALLLVLFLFVKGGLRWPLGF